MDNCEDERQATGLSKNLMQMKFMQRSALCIEKEQHEDDGKLVDEEHWVLDVPYLQPRDSTYIIEPSFAVCANLRCGRISFGGMNPAVEKLMRIVNENTDHQASADKEEANTVSEQEMVKRYNSLVGTISRKFKTRHQQEKDDEGSSLKRKRMMQDLDSFLMQQRAEVACSQEEPANKEQKMYKRKFLKPADAP